MSSRVGKLYLLCDRLGPCQWFPIWDLGWSRGRSPRYGVRGWWRCGVFRGGMRMCGNCICFWSSPCCLCIVLVHLLLLWQCRLRQFGHIFPLKGTGVCFSLGSCRCSLVLLLFCCCVEFFCCVLAWFVWSSSCNCRRFSMCSYWRWCAVGLILENIGRLAPGTVLLHLFSLPS